MNTTTEGVVLKETKLSGNDRLCTLLTEQLGVIRATAKGAQSLRNKNSSGTVQFSSGQFTLYENRGRYYIDEVNCTQPFFELRGDICALALAQYLCELFIELARTPEDAKDELRLARSAFYYLSKGTKPQLLIKAATEMRLLAWEGYAPDLTMCRECGEFEKETMYFLIRSGQLICSDCCPAPAESCSALGKGMLMALRHTVYAEFEKLFAFSLPESTLKAFARACEMYTVAAIEKEPSTLTFFRTVSEI